MIKFPQNDAVLSNLSKRFSFQPDPVALKTEAPKPKLTVSPSPDRVKWDYRGQRQIIPLGQWLPKVAVDAYVAPNVVLAGQVTVWDGSSVWNGAVLRGDLNKITLGFCSNVQERITSRDIDRQVRDSGCHTVF
ncbi:Gamma carbonic anhydrase-like 1 [Raphanus sativus]|nr:Gamma carbonic anhydrase-like 1 [Raphanus sativus]